MRKLKDVKEEQKNVAHEISQIFAKKQLEVPQYDS